MSDAAEESIDVVRTNQVVGRKSWTAYLRLISLTAAKMLAVSFAFYGISDWLMPSVRLAVEQAGHEASLPMLAFAELSDSGIRNVEYSIYAFVILIFLYRWVVLRSYKVSINGEGVWLNYGVFPWAKGGDAIRWKDMDMAKYYPNFFSWITNTYLIEVNHKYTNSADFRANDIWAGRRVCRVISNARNKILSE